MTKFEDREDMVAWAAFAAAATAAGPSVTPKTAAGRADELLAELRKRIPGRDDDDAPETQPETQPDAPSDAAEKKTDEAGA